LSSKISRPAKFLSGGGGLYSTAGDYMVFAQMLLNQGVMNGVRLLGESHLSIQPFFLLSG